MINSFKESKVSDSAVVYSSTLSQIKKLYEKNPVMAGELAISAIELALTGEISSDDYMIEIMLENIKVINEKNKDKYNKKVESQKQKRIEENKLDVIANLHLQGYKQKQIAEKLGITQQKVSYWLGVIRSEFPFLLTENTENTQKTENTTYDNVNDNDNDNVNKGMNGVEHHPYLGGLDESSKGDVSSTHPIGKRTKREATNEVLRISTNPDGSFNM